jgi:hypothetical protein
MSLNSYVGHSFEAREMPGKTGKCLGRDMTCRVGYFTVNKNDEQRKFRQKIQHKVHLCVYFFFFDVYI